MKIKKVKLILFLAMVLYIVGFIYFSFWKYDNFLYNGRDLAIFNQVFYNSLNSFSQGTSGLFASSIQGHNFLGDHFTPIVILLLPFYYLWQSPKTLLVLQTIVLALSAVPVYLIAKFVMSSWAPNLF